MSLILVIASGPAAAACAGSWTVVSTPNVGEPGGDFDNGLSSLAVVSASDLWAVGNSGTYGAARSTLAVHWNGSKWSIVATPDGANEVNWLIGADAVASNDVWAAGYSATNPPEQSQRVTLIEHWNGTQWSVVPSPNPTPRLSGGPVSNELYGIAAVAANDVWAVGQSVDYGAGQTLIVHWNGTAWSAVSAPHPGLYSTLRSVSVVTGNDIWAVGTHVVNGSQLTLIEHWNGTTWSVVPSPNDGPYVQELLRVRAVSSSDVWAVGYHLAVFGVSQVYQTTILHWNGSSWTVVPSPDLNQRSNYLWSVDGTSASDAWAVGFYDTGTTLDTVTQHWDGIAWTVQSSPSPSDYISELSDVAALSPTEVWTVGQSSGLFTFETLALHRSAVCGATMHVAGIDPSFNASRDAVNAKVSVKDQAGAVVAGASVTVMLTKPDGSHVTSTRTTNATGRASFSGTVSGPGAYTFTVTDVAKTGLTYDPTANTETSDTVVVG
jgi:hypothetical protein